MKIKYHIIVISAVPSTCEQVAAVLAKRSILSEQKYIKTLTELTEALADFQSHLIISDSACTTLDSMTVLNHIEKQKSGIPVIVITNRMDDTAALSYMKAGAADVIAAEHLERLSFVIQNIFQEKTHAVGNTMGLSGGSKEAESISDWKERYDLIVASTNQLVYDYNVLDGSILWRGNSIEVTGFDVTELSGGIKQWMEMIHPDDKDRSVRLLEQAEREHKPFDVEYSFKHKSKGYAWIHDRGFFIYDASGRAVRMLGAMEDVSVRKKVEGELYRSRQMMQLVLDHIPQRVFWKDRNYRYLGCNKAFLGDAGLSDINQILGKDDFELNWKDTAPLYRADDRFVMESNKPKLNYEEPQYRTDGSSSWLRTSKTPLYNQDGTVIGVLGMYEDITDQKKMELALRESEIKYRELVDKSLVGIYITQLHIVKFCNKRFAEIFGFSSPDEIIGTHVKSLISEESWESVDTQVKLRESGKIDASHYEFKGQRKDGSIIDVEVLSIRIIFEGKPAVQGTLIDITDKKAFQTQMLRSQRLESLGTLAGGIAHDLNNVLSPILLSIEILKKHLKDDKSLQILDTVNTSASRGRAIIKQVLTFARGFSGEHVVLQPLHILRELDHIISETFPKSIKLEARLPKDLWTIEADPTQIHQVLLNVAINARDAMPYGGTLKITAENATVGQNDLPAGTNAKPGSYLKVGIEDSGTGIPPEIVEKIFEPFFTTKERGKGTGLGLSTVHSIVNSHRGYITVRTELGKGTLFTIYLPAVEERKSQKTQDLLRIPEGNGETILVVDDEQSILDIMKNTLELYGYRIMTAHNGIEALSIYTHEKDRIDVVITDLIMPSLDGMTMARNLRKMNPGVKIITSSGIKISEADSANLGNVNHIFLQKPYTAEKLLSTLQEILYPKKSDTTE